MAITNPLDGDKLLGALIDARSVYLDTAAIHARATHLFWNETIAPAVRGQLGPDSQDYSLISLRSGPRDDAVNGSARWGVTLRTSLFGARDVIVDTDQLEADHPGLMSSRVVDRGLVDVKEFESGRVLIDAEAMSDCDSLIADEWERDSKFSDSGVTTGQRLDTVIRLNMTLRTCREAEHAANRALFAWLCDHPDADLPCAVAPMLFPRITLKTGIPFTERMQVCTDTVIGQHKYNGSPEYELVNMRPYFNQAPRFGHVRAWARTDVYGLTVPDTRPYEDSDLEHLSRWDRLRSLAKLRDAAPNLSIRAYTPSSIHLKMCEVYAAQEWTRA